MHAPPEPRPTLGYVVSTWPRLSQTFVLNEILALERRGLPVRIFSVKDPGGEPTHATLANVRAPVAYLSFRRRRRTVLAANARIARACPGRYVGTLLRALRYGQRAIMRCFFQAGYLAELVRRDPVDHLHAHFATAPALVAMFAHDLVRIPYTFTAHARDIYVDTPPALLRAEAQRARAVITCTEYNRQYLSHQIGSAASDKLRCIYHGLDLSQFQFTWPRTLDPEPPVILSVGRLVEKKGLGHLIMAAEILRRRGHSFEVEIIGSGPQHRTLEEQVTRLGLNDRVKLAGAQSHDVVCRAYQRAAVFALPCVVAGDGDRDGIPNVLLEAMGSGIPVVSTPVSGIPELIESERNGLLVPPEDPARLADALERLLTSAELRERLGRAARAEIEAHFSIDGSSTQLLELFRHDVLS